MKEEDKAKIMKGSIESNALRALDPNISSKNNMVAFPCPLPANYHRELE